MALSINEINTHSHKYFDPTLKQQVYDKSVFFKKLQAERRVKADGGTSVQWPIRIAKLGTATSTGFRTKVDFQSKETRTGADDDWAAYKVDTMVHWDETTYNKPKGKIFDIVKEKYVEMKEDLQDELAYDFLTRTTQKDSQSLQPLNVIVDETGSYGGIAVADAADWKSPDDDATTQLKLYGSASLGYYVDQATFGQDGPNLIITTRELKSKYTSLLTPQTRYRDENTANLGFDNVLFENIPVVGDVYLPAGYLYGLDMKMFEIKENQPLETTDWFDLKQAGYPNAMAKYASCVMQVICRRRRTNFKFTALDYTL
jgi:hypothetical protein